MALNISCTNEQQVPVTANPVTAGGQPASLDPNAPFRVTVIAGDGTAELPGAGFADNHVCQWHQRERGRRDDRVSGRGRRRSVDGRAVHFGESVFLRVHVPQAASLGFTVGTPESK